MKNWHNANEESPPQVGHYWCIIAVYWNGMEWKLQNSLEKVQYWENISLLELVETEKNSLK